MGKPFQPTKPPLSLFMAAALCLLAALFLTPELLIALGPMRQSLTSEIELVRQTALMEVSVIRWTCLIFCGCLVGFVVFWKKLAQSRWMLNISRQEPIESDRQKKWNVPFNFSFFSLLAVVILAVLFVASGKSVFTPSQLDAIMEEDGIVEQATAIVFLACAFLSFIIAVKSRRWKSRIIHTFFAIGFFLFFGEELSWGQRIFHFKTPELMNEINVQDEFNLHNLLGYFADHLFVAGIFLYGVLVPLLNSFSPFWRRVFHKTGIPVASISLAIGFFLISVFHDWTILRVLPRPGFGVAELRELMASFGLFLLMIESYILALDSRT